MTVVNPITGNQVTRYLYGTQQTSISPIIYRNDLLTAEIYPDSVENPADGIADRVEYQYNRLGERVWKRDQNGTVHQYDYDNLGRMIHDRVTDVGTGVDTAVRRISTVYNINGQVERLTSWDNPVVGNGSIVNEVRYEYNQYGLLGKEYSNPVGGAGMLKYTQYFYDSSKSGEYFTNELRLIGITYPSGNTVTYSYGQIGLADDLLNRPVSVLYNNVVQATYEYQGIQTPITTTFPVPNLSLDYSEALDRYNRVVKQNWKNGNGESIVDIQHDYDRSDNRLNRIDAVGGTTFNEQYSYDGMNQLINKSMESSFERFHYDAAGNHVQTTTDSAVETQTFNKANEIIAINNNSNAVSHDRNGNMTRIPGKDLRYDAWNRLVCVTHNGLIVAQYRYNALNHRVIKTTPFETRYYYFNRNWQCLEEYADNSATPGITYVWGLRYIDDMVCRIRNSETLYSIADANWNTVALANSSGNIVERYSYDAFGTLHIYDASFNNRVASNYFWTRAFTGQVIDPETGLMLYRNRYYSPSLGRFITRDPIGYEGNDWNLYRYVKNTYTDYRDRFGLQTLEDMEGDGCPGSLDPRVVPPSSHNSNCSLCNCDCPDCNPYVPPIDKEKERICKLNQYDKCEWEAIEALKKCEEIAECNCKSTFWKGLARRGYYGCQYAIDYGGKMSTAGTVFGFGWGCFGGPGGVMTCTGSCAGAGFISGVIGGFGYGFWNGSDFGYSDCLKTEIAKCEDVYKKTIREICIPLKGRD